MLSCPTRWALEAPRRVVACVALFVVGAAIFAFPVVSDLSAGGFADPGAESSRANQLLAEKFGKGDVQLVLLVTEADLGEPGADVGRRIADALADSPDVLGVMSPWTSPPAVGQGLRSEDGAAGLIVADLRGGESDGPGYARALLERIEADIVAGSGVTVTAGGSAMVFSQITEQTLRDVLIMESIAVPLSLAVLVWVFGGLVAATVPVLVAAVAIVGSMALLRLIALGTEVSIFALNLATALGLALAIDYTLLIVSRYRDELAAGRDPAAALRITMATAGRTIVFSALTVALSMSTLLLFDVPFLRSFGYAGVITVALSAAAALLFAPALMTLLGTRLAKTSGRHGRGDGPELVQHRFWFRSTEFVLRHALPIGLAGTVLLVAVGLPFLNVKWGYPDDRVLPATASAHQVGDRLRADFVDRSGTETTVVVPDADGLTEADWADYAAALSRVDGVTAVAAPVGAFVDGQPVGPAPAGAEIAGGSAYLTVSGQAALFSPESETQLPNLRAVPGPGERAVLMTGSAAVNRDSIDSIAAKLPLVLGITALVIFAVLFVLTRSVVLPLKALVLNILSLSAAFGALVWIFQEGHLGAFGTTPTGTLVATIPVLLFCIAFGLSMDYEVFLLARIREFWLRSAKSASDLDRSVVLGLAYTGRVVTAAAAIMTISFAGLIAAQVSFMRMFGVGLVLAVLVDATLVRMVLLPAYMKLMGRLNWWAPSWR
ncbi:membrane protein [Mycolicibacterium parafortuitum]|uniref:MMPL family transporter n=1 Tax=Mycolicibacterium parafortuitum TaxID=39692 RepID=UPI0032C49D3B